MGRIFAAYCGIISIVLSGCSTIVKGTEQQVSVSTPGGSGRNVSAHIARGRNAHCADAGQHRLAQEQTQLAVSCTAQCYSPGVGTLGSHTEVMTAGNVIFGGLIGLGVDAASGAMNTYDSSV
jgi:hypothetical protein